MNAWERFFRKPCAEWGRREKWVLRGASLAIGFFSIEVLYVVAWIQRGYYNPLTGFLHLLALALAIFTVIQTERKLRSRLNQ